jgi:hypothetical protein
MALFFQFHGDEELLHPLAARLLDGPGFLRADQVHKGAAGLRPLRFCDGLRTVIFR